MKGGLRTLVLLATIAIVSAALKLEHEHVHHQAYLASAVDFYSIKPFDHELNFSNKHEAYLDNYYDMRENHENYKMTVSPPSSLVSSDRFIVSSNSESIPATTKALDSSTISRGDSPVTSLQPAKNDRNQGVGSQSSSDADRAMAGLSVVAVILAVTMTIIQPVIPLT